jgi:hypothetical protein
MKLIDKRCNNCKKVFTDLFDDDSRKCDCGGVLERLYSSPRLEIFQAGYYENFEFEPIYIETKKQFNQELKKRGLVRVW